MLLEHREEEELKEAARVGGSCWILRDNSEQGMEVAVESRQRTGDIL